jgi:predicted ATPase
VVAVARATTTASARARSIGRNRIADTIRGDFVGR